MVHKWKKDLYRLIRLNYIHSVHWGRLMPGEGTPFKRKLCYVDNIFACIMYKTYITHSLPSKYVLYEPSICILYTTPHNESCSTVMSYGTRQTASSYAVMHLL